MSSALLLPTVMSVLSRAVLLSYMPLYPTLIRAGRAQRVVTESDRWATLDDDHDGRSGRHLSTPH